MNDINYNNNVNNNTNNKNHINYNIDVIRSNFIILKSLAESIKPSFGPNGISKIIVDDKSKSVIISSDGFIILKYFKIKHPIGKLIKQQFLNQSYLLYGGVSTSLLLSSSLMENALNLLYKGLDLNSIISGYKISLNYSLKYLNEMKSIKLDIKLNEDNSLNKDNLLNIFNIIVQEKGTELNNNDYLILKDILSDSLISQNHSKKSIETKLNNINISIDQIYQYSDFEINNNETLSKFGFKNYTNNEITTTSKILLIENGLIVDKNYCCSYLNEIKEEGNNINILFLDCSLSRDQSNMQIQLELDSPEKLLNWKIDEENYFKQLITTLVNELHVNTIICTGDIDPLALHYIDQFKILAFKFVPYLIFKKLSLSTEIIYHLNLDSILQNKNKIVSKHYEKILLNPLQTILCESRNYYFKLNQQQQNDNNKNNSDDAEIEIQKTIIILSETYFQSQELKRYCQDLLMGLKLLNNNNNNTLNFNENENKEISNKYYILGGGEVEKVIVKSLLDMSQQESSILKYSIESFSNSFQSLLSILKLAKPIELSQKQLISPIIYDNYFLKKKQIIDSTNLVLTLLKDCNNNTLTHIHIKSQTYITHSHYKDN
ncbi:hypothetical protein ACTFIR_004949 [Dictyostelium discoideum]